MTAAVPQLALENIYKSYNKQPILQGVSLAAFAGDVICLLGNSGAGKSTLLRCANLLEHPDSGAVSLNGKQIDPKQHPQAVLELRTRVAMVFQQFNLWPHMTVLENIIAAPMHVLKQPKAAVIELAEKLLKKLNILDMRDRYPGRLSGGQQQRVAIARALAMNPEVLLFDEPTSSLDPNMVDEVIAVIRNLAAEGRAIIIATHELRFARHVSTQIAFLEQGKILELGSTENIFSQPKSEKLKQFISSQIV